MPSTIYTDEYNLFIRALSQAREEAGLSQRELARIMTFDAMLSAEELKQQESRMQRFISRCERGERRMDILECYYYCKASKIDFMKLVDKTVKAWDKINDKQ